MKRSYFYSVIVPMYLQANIDSKDKISDVLAKLDAVKDKVDQTQFDSIKAFFRGNWNIEKEIFAAVIGNLEYYKTEAYFRDPALDDTILLRTPGHKFVKFQDFIYKRCSGCGGRLFEEFNFCPFCGKETPKGLDLSPIPIPEYCPPEGMRELRRGLGPRLGRKFVPPGRGMNRLVSDVVFKDDEVEVTQADLDKVEKNLSRYVKK